MYKSTSTAVLLIAIIFTGAITASLISIIKVDAKEDDDMKKEKLYDDKSYDSNDDYKKYQQNDENKYDNYNDESVEYGSYTKNQKDYYDKDTTTYKKSLYDKPKPKVKIVNCNNRNINAAGIEDINTIKPILDNALALKKVKDKMMNLDTYQNKISDPSDTQVYYLGPDTKIIVLCGNENHFISPLYNTESKTLTSNDNIKTVENIASNTNDVTNDTTGFIQSNIESSDNTSLQPSTVSSINPSPEPEGPFIFPFPTAKN